MASAKWRQFCLGLNMLIWRIILKHPKLFSALFVALYIPCKLKPKFNFENARYTDNLYFIPI